MNINLLPWKLTELGKFEIGCIDSKEKHIKSAVGKLIAIGLSSEDAEYMVEACNALPELFELTRQFKEFCMDKVEIKESGFDVFLKVENTLKKAGLIDA